MKQIHIITGKGCDLCPTDSFQIVDVDSNGIRWIKQGRDSIHPSVTSQKVDSSYIKHAGICVSCENVFNEDGFKQFVPQQYEVLICKRCHEKRTIVNRNV